jgi:hypothetical protein
MSSKNDSLNVAAVLRELIIKVAELHHRVAPVSGLPGSTSYTYPLSKLKMHEIRSAKHAGATSWR